LTVDSVEPRAVQRFWAAALGGPAQRALLSFRPQSRAKTVKNRVHLDVYVCDVERLLDLGARVLAEYRPQSVTLADVEGNEFCAFLDPALDEGPPAQALPSAPTVIGLRSSPPGGPPRSALTSAKGRTALRAGSMAQRAGRA
jgi:hypothetical protein